jgi:chromate transporter
MTPGPGALLVPLVGLQAAGIMGAIVAALAIFVPSSVLVFGLAHVWARFKGKPWIRAIEAGLVPVAAGMVLSASFTVLRAAEGGWWAWAVAGLSTLALLTTRLSPFLMLGVGAVIFLVAVR